MGLRYAIKEICAYGPKRSAREDERVCPSGKSGTKISPYSVYERGTRPQWSSGEIGGRGTLSFREQNTVGFHRANQMAALLLAGIKNTGVGVPAVHQDIGPRLIRKRAKNLQGHVDFRAVFRAAAFQGITQRSISGPNDGSMDLMPIDDLPLQMGVMPSGPLCWTFRL